jgi:hypothetical protein
MLLRIILLCDYGGKYHPSIRNILYVWFRNNGQCSKKVMIHEWKINERIKWASACIGFQLIFKISSLKHVQECTFCIYHLNLFSSLFLIVLAVLGIEQSDLCMEDKLCTIELSHIPSIQFNDTILNPSSYSWCH